jgi:acetolactate synthase-1/2/3 large subunit
MLRRGKRPLFFLGSGARRALSRYGSEFEQCIRAMNVPVTTSVRAKGLFPESHPLSLGVFGIAGSLRAKEYVKDGIDTLIVLGSRLGEWATGGNLTELRNARTIVHVDLNPAIFGQVVPAHYALTCDAGEFIRTLHTATSSSKAAAVTDPISEEAKPQIAGIRLSRRVQPSELVSELSQCLRPDMDIYVDMGNCTGWAVRNLIVDPPTRIFIPTGLASMGWSCGAVIGGRIARPERQAVALVGDGAFLMNGNEVATAARHRIGVVYVVLDDGYLGMVNHGESWQTGSDLSDDFYSTGPADLPQFARSLGANVVHIESPKQLLHELPLALKQATSHGIPQVLVAAVNHLEVPPYGERFATVGGDR